MFDLKKPKAISNSEWETLQSLELHAFCRGMMGSDNWIKLKALREKAYGKPNKLQLPSAVNNNPKTNVPHIPE